MICYFLHNFTSNNKTKSKQQHNNLKKYINKHYINARIFNCTNAHEKNIIDFNGPKSYFQKKIIEHLYHVDLIKSQYQICIINNHVTATINLKYMFHIRLDRTLDLCWLIQKYDVHVDKNALQKLFTYFVHSSTNSHLNVDCKRFSNYVYCVQFTKNNYADNETLDRIYGNNNNIINNDNVIHTSSKNVTPDNCKRDHHIKNIKSNQCDNAVYRYNKYICHDENNNVYQLGSSTPTLHKTILPKIDENKLLYKLSDTQINHNNYNKSNKKNYANAFKDFFYSISNYIRKSNKKKSVNKLYNSSNNELDLNYSDGQKQNHIHKTNYEPYFNLHSHSSVITNQISVHNNSINSVEDFQNPGSSSLNHIQSIHSQLHASTKNDCTQPLERKTSSQIKVEKKSSSGRTTSLKIRDEQVTNVLKANNEFKNKSSEEMLENRRSNGQRMSSITFKRCLPLAFSKDSKTMLESLRKKFDQNENLKRSYNVKCMSFDEIEFGNSSLADNNLLLSFTNTLEKNKSLEPAILINNVERKSENTISDEDASMKSLNDQDSAVLPMDQKTSLSELNSLESSIDKVFNKLNLLKIGSPDAKLKYTESKLAEIARSTSFTISPPQGDLSPEQTNRPQLLSFDDEEKELLNESRYQSIAPNVAKHDSLTRTDKSYQLTHHDSSKRKPSGQYLLSFISDCVHNKSDSLKPIHKLQSHESSTMELLKKMEKRGVVSSRSKHLSLSFSDSTRRHSLDLNLLSLKSNPDNDDRHKLSIMDKKNMTSMTSSRVTSVGPSTSKDNEDTSETSFDTSLPTKSLAVQSDCKDISQKNNKKSTGRNSSILFTSKIEKINMIPDKCLNENRDKSFEISEERNDPVQPSCEALVSNLHILNNELTNHSKKYKNMISAPEKHAHFETPLIQQSPNLPAVKRSKTKSKRKFAKNDDIDILTESDDQIYKACFRCGPTEGYSLQSGGKGPMKLVFSQMAKKCKACVHRQNLEYEAAMNKNRSKSNPKRMIFEFFDPSPSNTHCRHVDTKKNSRKKLSISQSKSSPSVCRNKVNSFNLPVEIMAPVCTDNFLLVAPIGKQDKLLNPFRSLAYYRQSDSVRHCNLDQRLFDIEIQYQVNFTADEENVVPVGNALGFYITIFSNCSEKIKLAMKAFNTNLPEIVENCRFKKSSVFL